MVINKNQLIKLVSDRSELSAVDVEMVCNTLLQAMQEEVVKGNPVLIKGFIKIYRYRADSRPVRNFKENRHVQSGERNLPRCEFSPAFIKKIKKT